MIKVSCYILDSVMSLTPKTNALCIELNNCLELTNNTYEPMLNWKFHNEYEEMAAPKLSLTILTYSLHVVRLTTKQKKTFEPSYCIQLHVDVMQPNITEGTFTDKINI